MERIIFARLKGKGRRIQRVLWTWFVHFREDVTKPTGYRILVPAVVTLIASYVGIYTLVEARHERQLNRATFERATFITLTTSSNGAAFIAGMKTFGQIQNMYIRAEPSLWKFWGWFRKYQPNYTPLRAWSSHFFSAYDGKANGTMDFRQANLREAKLSWANLPGTHLEGANLQQADLGWSNLRDAEMDYHILVDLPRGIYRKTRKTNLEEARLFRADLTGANLRGANLQNAILIETKLIGANLQGADLRKANMKKTDLRGANLYRADLRGVYNIEQSQINVACIDQLTTILPKTILYPTKLIKECDKWIIQ